MAFSYCLISLAALTYPSFLSLLMKNMCEASTTCRMLLKTNSNFQPSDSNIWSWPTSGPGAGPALNLLGSSCYNSISHEVTKSAFLSFSSKFFRMNLFLGLFFLINLNMWNNWQFKHKGKSSHIKRHGWVYYGNQFKLSTINRVSLLLCLLLFGLIKQGLCWWSMEVLHFFEVCGWELFAGLLLLGQRSLTWGL